MESNGRIADAAAVSSEDPAQDATTPASGEDVHSRKRSRETDSGDLSGDQDPSSVQIENANPNKRSRIDEVTANGDDGASPNGASSTIADNPHDDPPTLSKNQLRKQRRQQKFEDRREQRKQLRKDKRHEKTARKREEREAKAEELAQALGIDKAEALRRVEQEEYQQNKKGSRTHSSVPVAIIIDCDFEKYMHENELVSLAGQVTRSYSMNRMGTYMAHLVVSSWGGKLKERFDTVLKAHHHQWRGVTFVEGDFVQGGKMAWDIMHSAQGGKTCPALGGEPTDEEAEEPGKEKELNNPTAPNTDDKESSDEKPMAPAFSTDSIVYLSADSPNTLDKLEPNTSYVIGGLVDRNREKLLCQRRAEQKGIRTAKLPIGEYLQMSSRKVLATNHVVEIMSKWLETGDWAQAFMEVIPKRKGGELKNAEDGDKEEDGKDEGTVNAVDQEMVDAGADVENGDKPDNGAGAPEA